MKATGLKKNQTVTVKITGLGSSGEGVGKVDGFTVFVPGALTGETVEAKLQVLKKSYGSGVLTKVLEASPDRVEPRCKVYKECGGCQLQHLAYEAELREKRQQVYDALTRLGHLEGIKVLPTLGSNDPWYYRNKMQFPVAGSPGKLKIGCFAAFTHQVIDVEDCCIQKQPNNQICQVLRTWMKQYKIPAYDEDKRTGMIRHIMGRVGVRTGEIMVCLVTSQEMIPHLKDLVQMLRKALPGLTSVAQNINTRHTNVILGPKTRLVYGKETIQDKIGSLKFHISAQSFFQVNSEQAEALYGQALDFAQLTGKETVVDVYCGTGTITLFLARHAQRVYGIEIVPSAIRDAKKNAGDNKITNAEFSLGDAAYKLPELLARGIRPDVIVLDPPRAGCEEKVLEAIARVQPKRVVYVSCNPATLARDLAYLVGRGFKAVKAQPVDMFSRSHHVESIALLQRKISKNP